MSTHDAPHEHAFDGEPVSALAADEPRTPGWLPALGGAIFVVAAVWFLAISKGDDTAAAAAAASASAAASAVAAPASAPAAPHPAAPPPEAGARPRSPVQPIKGPPFTREGAPAATPPPPASAVHKYTPEELARLKKAIQEHQGK